MTQKIKPHIRSLGNQKHTHAILDRFIVPSLQKIAITNDYFVLKKALDIYFILNT